ncbi:PREDICTED: mevalonate kinase-like [Acromyrmex echinatior]|uniref:mevalonate kinase-like n=1 Tax=Acromyrmex echinatior TaxID=103372 RepID=UPI000580F9F7|nr:PREDICTED: mevalonate kinase-like [Acromyrmex echinatior]
MYRFNVSAPGTVFLCGEPKRRNQTCIAASLDMRTTLTFSSFPLSVVKIEFIGIDFPSIQLDMRISLRQFYVHFYGENYKNWTSCVMLHEAVKNFITTIMKDYEGTYKSNNQTHQLSLQAFFFLLILISQKENIIITSTFMVKLSTELPIGEGLGSSASFAVCLAACFYRWSLLQKGIVVYEFGRQDLLKISSYAQKCESTIYNSSTCIDITISTYGMIKIFDGGITSTLRAKSFSNIPYLKILFFSNVDQKTKSEKSMKIASVKNSDLLLNSILESIEVMSSTIVFMLDSINLKVHNNLKNIDIIHMNQGLLKSLGMSHPNLDIISAIARKFLFAAKLAGKSESRHGFILLPNASAEDIDNLITELKSYNFSAKITSLNCNGIRVE